MVSLPTRNYKEAWEYQTAVHAALIEQKRAVRRGESIDRPIGHHLIFCEHDPVYTLGKSGKVKHLLYSEEQLADYGIVYHKINRGGDITYHGPGQWTVYPVLDLDGLFNDVHKYVRLLEQVVINVCAHYGVQASREEGYTGVWTGEAKDRKKICAIGVHLSRWVSLHGFAFNIDPALEHFSGIIPCGIDENNKSVTSLVAESGRAISMQDAKELIIKEFIDLFDLKIKHQENTII